MKNPNILVPVNFTDESKTAIAHAMELAKKMEVEVILLHLVETKDELDNSASNLALEEAYANGLNPSIKVTSYSRVGSPTEEIDSFAKEHHSSLIVMGTQGAKGMEKVLGSHALKIVTDADSPVIVVQQKSNNPTYNKILVPIDLNDSTKQKLEAVRDIAQYFNSSIILISPEESDEFLKDKVSANIQWAKQYLAEEGVVSGHVIVDKRRFTEEIIETSKELNVDLIAIMNLQKVSFFGLLNSGFEETMITNKYNIPVLCVNPKISSTGWSPIFFAYSTN